MSHTGGPKVHGKYTTHTAALLMHQGGEQRIIL